MTNSLSSTSSAAERLSGERLCILLVDDDPDDVLLTEQVLQATLQCRIETAATGEQALDKIAEAREIYHAILLDNGLPDMSGLDVLAELRVWLHSVPVVLVTGYGGEATVLSALRQGASDYVVKTGDYLQMLPEVVAQVIERERLRRRAEHLESEHVRFARFAAVGEVAAGIAHEIRNPMTVIAGMASMVHDNHRSMQPEFLEECTQMIVDNCHQLNRVVDEVLQSASASPAREAISLRTVFEETLSFMRFDMEWRNHMEVRTNFETAQAIVGNSDQLKQVLINLFRNAYQAVQMAGRINGEVHITLREDKAAREVIAEIRDDGSGIEESSMPHIFESGYSTKGREDAVKGSGLGLSICRRIIEEHNGRLWAESKVGEGATFLIALPFAPQ